MRQRTERADRAKKRKTQQSLLTSKLFDETGDRLTPSQSKSKTGTRLRYYISHRLVAGSGNANNDGWRLPALELELELELEGTVESLVRSHLGRSGAVLEIVPDCPAVEVQSIRDRLDIIAASKRTEDIVGMAARVDLAPGAVTIALCPKALAYFIGVDPARVASDLPAIRAPIRTRKRGVETKIILNGVAHPIDETLLGNIASAHAGTE